MFQPVGQKNPRNCLRVKVMESQRAEIPNFDSDRSAFGSVAKTYHGLQPLPSIQLYWLPRISKFPSPPPAHDSHLLHHVPG